MSRHDPYSTARETRDAERVDKVLGRKSGGRVAEDSDTNIHIEVNASPKEQDAEPTAGPIPPPPPLPMAPPPGSGPLPGLGGGGLGGGGGPIGLKRGGAAKDCGPGMRSRRRDGGAVPDLGKKGKVDVGGAGGGTGRLEKAADAKRAR